MTPDYSQVPIPEAIEPDKYSYVDRRAEILRMIEEKGHPWGFNFSELGRRYGVSHTTIRKDFETLKEWYRDRIGQEAGVISEIAFKKIVREHISNGNYEKARRAIDSWNNWLQDTGKQEREPSEHDVRHQGEIKQKHETEIPEERIRQAHELLSPRDEEIPFEENGRH